MVLRGIRIAEAGVRFPPGPPAFAKASAGFAHNNTSLLTSKFFTITAAKAARRSPTKAGKDFWIFLPPSGGFFNRAQVEVGIHHLGSYRHQNHGLRTTALELTVWGLTRHSFFVCQYKFQEKHCNRIWQLLYSSCWNQIYHPRVQYLSIWKHRVLSTYLRPVSSN